MARPKRSNIDTLCDLFADLSIDAQGDEIKAKIYEDAPILAGEDDVERARRLA